MTEKAQEMKDLAKAGVQTAANKQALTILEKKRDDIAALLESKKDILAQALPKHITKERLIRVALTAMSKTPRLFECSTASLLGAVMTAGQMGLEPDSPLGQANLVPYHNKKTNRFEAQFQVGYLGWIDLFYRTGDIKNVVAEVVREGDVFEIERGTNEHLKHVPVGDESKKIAGAYAYVVNKLGGMVFEYMSIEAINKRRAVSKNSDGNIWNQWPAEMCKKTVLKALRKRVHMSVEMAKAGRLDDMIETDKPQNLDIHRFDPAMGEIPLEMGDEKEPVGSAEVLPATPEKPPVPAQEPAKEPSSPAAAPPVAPTAPKPIKEPPLPISEPAPQLPANFGMKEFVEFSEQVGKCTDVKGLQGVVMRATNARNEARITQAQWAAVRGKALSMADDFKAAAKKKATKKSEPQP
jgi:recombination protein RecT